MSNDELDWQKNVKPVKWKKITFNVDCQVNLQPVNNKKLNHFFPLQGNAFNVDLSFCLDYNTKSKVDRGKYFISARLDLHGYSIDNAYYKLISFIIKNYQVGNRCLLVITGNGHAINKMGTIKNNLYKWLNDTKIQHIILYYQQATKEHGSKGAFYILLRRNKNLK